MTTLDHLVLIALLLIASVGALATAALIYKVYPAPIDRLIDWLEK